MPSYIEKRRRRWYAVLDVPKDLQESIGKRRFVESLKTETQTVAERRAAPLVAGWKLKIEKARSRDRDPLEEEAIYWREILALTSDEDEREGILEHVMEKAESIMLKTAPKGVQMGANETQWNELPGYEEAERFHGIATGQLVNLEDHLEEWLATTEDTPKSKDMKRSDVKRLGLTFPTVDKLHRKDVRRWVSKLINEDGLKPASVARLLSSYRGYWRYLQSIEVVSEDIEPFERLEVAKRASKKNSPKDKRQPFDAIDVVRLQKAATDKGDNIMSDLITLGMWTGCRLEELCALKIDKVKPTHFDIEDAKTEAGWRQIPIHRKLKPVMKRLTRDSKDGYVLSGLSFNKYGDRSNAVGKRFGRLKTDAGFDGRYVFHSIRKTVATLLENAGIPENVAADIIGHDKPTMTYGLYSGGASLKLKTEALAKISYPSPAP